VSGTIYAHLAAAIEAGESLDLNRLFSASEQEELAAAFARAGFGSLMRVHDLLGGRFEPGALRVFRAAQARGR